MMQKFTQVEDRKNMDSCTLNLINGSMDNLMYQQIAPFHMIR